MNMMVAVPSPPYSYAQIRRILISVRSRINDADLRFNTLLGDARLCMHLYPIRWQNESRAYQSTYASRPLTDGIEQHELVGRDTLDGQDS